MELEINGHKYRTQKLNAKMQFHVSRKLAPLLIEFGTLANILSMAKSVATAHDGEAPDGDVPKADTSLDMKAFGPIADAFARLPEADCDYVLERCLSNVYRLSGGGSVAMWNAAAERFQFDDIDMIEMIRLAFAVIQESLANFIPALPSALNVSVGTGQNSSR